MEECGEFIFAMRGLPADKGDCVCVSMRDKRSKPLSHNGARKFESIVRALSSSSTNLARRKSSWKYEIKIRQISAGLQ